MGIQRFVRKMTFGAAVEYDSSWCVQCIIRSDRRMLKIHVLETEARRRNVTLGVVEHFQENIEATVSGSQAILF